MNSEILYQVVFLDKTGVFGNGSDFKIWNDGTNQSAKRKPVPSTRYITVHGGRQSRLCFWGKLNYCIPQTTKSPSKRVRQSY